MIEVLQALGDGNPAISLAPLFETMLEGIVVRNAYGKVVGCNRTARCLLGLRSGDFLVGGALAPLPDYLREDGSVLPHEEHPANLTLRSGEALQGVVLGIARKDGDVCWISVNSQPLRDSDAMIVGVVESFTDITPMKSAMAELRVEERRRHELFERVARLERMELVATLSSVIAHDFNNVLVAILGYSELADAHLKVDGRLPRVEGYIDEIRIAGNRARGLIRQLLDFSRSGTAQPRLTQLDLVGRDAVGLLRATLPDTVAVIDEIGRDLPALSVDPAHVYQIVMNLLVNARDAVNGCGTIRVGTRRVLAAHCPVCASCRREFEGEFIALTVSDDGHGIPLANRSRLFEPFFTTKEPGRGTGMGLPVVHGMTHLYDGHVLIESVLGGGTRVEVLLPVVLTQVPGIVSQAVPGV